MCVFLYFYSSLICVLRFTLFLKWGFPVKWIHLVCVILNFYSFLDFSLTTFLNFFRKWWHSLKIVTESVFMLVHLHPLLVKKTNLNFTLVGRLWKGNFMTKYIFYSEIFLNWRYFVKWILHLGKQDWWNVGIFEKVILHLHVLVFLCPCCEKQFDFQLESDKNSEDIFRSKCIRFKFCTS